MKPGNAPADRFAADPLRVVVMASVRWYNASAAYAVDLAEGLAERGAVVRLVVKPGSPVEEAARARGLDVVASADLTATRPAELLRSFRTLRRLFGSFQPHVVNAHRGEDHLLAAAALHGSGVPLVRTRGDVRAPRSHPGTRFLYRSLTAAHVACADFMPERFYPPLGIPASAVTVIRPGLDADAFRRDAPDPAAARSQLDLDPSTPWIGLVGRLTAVKGHRVLIRALSRMSGDPAPRLFLSGEPNEVSPEELQEEARRLGVGERVRIEGRVPDVRTALRALDVLAVPSLGSEAISRIALEALALGVPVVASRVNSLPEIVGDAGLLVEPGDPEDLARALQRMLRDEGLRVHARDEGPRRIEARYHRVTQLERTEALFRSLLQRGTAR